MEADRHDPDDGSVPVSPGVGGTDEAPIAAAFEYRIGKYLDNDLAEAVEDVVDLFAKSHDVRHLTEEEVEKTGADVVIDGKYYVITWKMEEVKDESSEGHSA
jgi:hypothetical protein